MVHAFVQIPKREIPFVLEEEKVKTEFAVSMVLMQE